MSTETAERRFEAPVAIVSDVPATAPLYAIAKRWMDIVGALCGLIISAPVMMLVALAIKLESRGPVLCWQTRVGKGRRLFEFCKLRSMVANADEEQEELQHLNERSGPIFKIKADPRITRVGRIIRKLSIDELPQLLHVLRGQMSLVGPRPPLPNEVQHYATWHLGRLGVKPGLTCIWQVNGRADVPFDEGVEMDLEYIRKRSILLDLKILFLTPFAVLRGHGAY